MPRAHYVKAARKANPVAEPGEPYFWWKFRHGGKRYSKTRPRPSQLTQSEKLSRTYALIERIEDLERPEADDPEALAAAIDAAIAVLDDVASEAREIAAEYQESAESIRAVFSDSETADQCDEKAEALEGWADEADTARDSLEGVDEDDPEAQADALGEALDSLASSPI
jgi:hypothetical protein